MLPVGFGTVQELSRQFGANPESLRPLGGGQESSDGVLYTYAPLAASAGGMGLRVLKCLPFARTDCDAIRRHQERVEFVRYLTDKGTRIVRPLVSASGNLYEIAEDSETVCIAYSYEKVQGRSVVQSDVSPQTGTFFVAMGATIGKLHSIWQEKPEELCANGCSNLSKVLVGWRAEWDLMDKWCQDEDVRRAWHHLRAAMEKLTIAKSTYGFVHNDAHVWHFLFDPDREPAHSGGEPEFTLIDFDVANYHFFALDAAIALYSIEMMGSRGLESRTPASLSYCEWAFQKFWQGYSRFRQPDQYCLSKIPLFLQYRRCLLFVVFQRETAKDPAWKQRWKARIETEDHVLT
jgi:amicoumacin kinase